MSNGHADCVFELKVIKEIKSEDGSPSSFIVTFLSRLFNLRNKTLKYSERACLMIMDSTEEARLLEKFVSEYHQEH